MLSTTVAVVSDAVLMPFFPRLFREVFAVHSAVHVGAYLAVTCLTVMVALPLWARIERHVPTLILLLPAQAVAGALSLACFFVDTVEMFWLCSLSMIAFKATYLLVYPYLLRIEPKEGHERVIAWLTVIVHLGGICGAVLGGALFTRVSPQFGFLVIAAADLLQMLGFLALFATRSAQGPTRDRQAHRPGFAALIAMPRLQRLGAMMLLFYFSVFTLRPFFVPYWEQLRPGASLVEAGWVYSIPAWMSALALWWSDRRSNTVRPDASVKLLSTLGLCLVGVLLQGIPMAGVVVVGRGIYGLCVFRIMVELDASLFRSVEPHDYVRAFSLINIAQQGGVLVAFYIAGMATEYGGPSVPFVVAVGGLLLTIVLGKRLT